MLPGMFSAVGLFPPINRVKLNWFRMALVTMPPTPT
jgi:hypothetical protein